MTTQLLKQLKINPKKYKPLTKEQALEKKLFEKERREFIDKFQDIMLLAGLYNEYRKTFRLIIDEKTNYGFKGRLYLRPPLTYDDLQKKIGAIQQNLQCIWIMKTKKFQEFAEIKIVTHPLDESKLYECPKNMKPNLFYLGLDFTLKPILVDVNVYCHFLCAGATRSGKTRLIYQTLLCWILGCKLNECEIYLADVSKDEYSYFSGVKMVRSYANTTEKLWKMLKYLKIKFEKRKITIGKMREEGNATNIAEYNRISKSKLSYCYAFIDEFSIITPKRSDREEVKKMKEEIMDIITELEKTGAGMGIFLFVGTQKPTKAELNDSIIKNQSAVRVCFRVNDMISSEVIMEDHSAVGLDPRYAVYSLAGGMDKDYLFSPTIETDDMRQMLKPHIDYNFKKIDIDAELKSSKEQVIQNVKVTELPKRKKEKYKNSLYPVYNSKNIESEDDYI